MSLTPEGFDRPRLPEIKTDYDASFTDALGPVNTEPDAVVGQIIGIFSAGVDDLYETLQATYDSMYPATASGTALDGAVSFVGMTRLGATPTEVIAMAYGTESTLIPAGAIARAIDNRQYVTTVDTVITRASAGDVNIEVNTVTNSTAYQIITDGTSVTYTSDASATISEILAGLAALFNPLNITATVIGSVLRLRTPDLQSDFTLTVDSKLTITKLGTPVTFTGLEVGAYALPANSLTRIDSALLGWDEINNLAAGATGRFVETDEALRIRHSSGVRATGAATLPAIRARLLAEVDSIEYVAIYENRTLITDAFGLPGKSFEAVVSGGLSQDIADKIWEVKPAGIQPYGNTNVDVLDDNGDVQSVGFSRTTTKYAWVKVTVNLLDPEEALPPTVIASITAAVLSYGNSIGIGKDIIPQRFYGPIYAATDGLANITVEADATATIGGPPTYTTATTVLARSESALFDASRIVIVGV